MSGGTGTGTGRGFAVIMSAVIRLREQDEMSQAVSDQDASVLGKRVHHESPQKPEEDVTPGPVEEDDDDDDIGPMPMPADASSNEGARKKRKGLSFATRSRRMIYSGGLVLPHEKLYLEHLPAADRYFKSFMHRDAINFNIITKQVFRLARNLPTNTEPTGLTTW